MKHTFKTIGVIGKQQDTEAIETLKAMKAVLSDFNVAIILEEKTATLLPGHSLEVLPLIKLGAACDLIIVVGGDGNLLNAARAISLAETPVLGINRGHLGFLTDIHPHALNEELSQVLEGQYSIEERFLLNVDLERDGNIEQHGNALNEVMLYHGGIGKMIEFEVYVDDDFVCSQRADGMIVSTPTGSTAYALSAHGPILNPDLDAIALVPLCPHTLSSRPIVVKGNSKITLVASPYNKIYPAFSCDSQLHFSIAPGDVLHIRKQPERLKLVHPQTYCYYETLRNKLQWGQKL